ncbi:tripartite tricarboxylate transporter TctB family protein [Clostridium sp. MCC353]|uniref:tripartite tricarboxylate transporter TctB family protein n=1 Tax=Clostridium sp. MCC353 TaxID=2592646 RepID=UPI001C02E88F|nr:tripartite tricarboxylate transporter TctB family protein [Clostridium sp. MCC353]
MKINTNLCTGIIFLVLGTAALFIIPTQIPAGHNDYGPRLFPYIVSVIMILSSLGVLAGEWGRYRKNMKKETVEVDLYELKRVGLMFLIMTAYIFLIEPLGFILSSALFVSGILVFFKSKNPVYYVVCIGLTAAIYYGFRIFLKVYLP